jgi:ADP-heptose:LPS heptosyltransferase
LGESTETDLYTLTHTAPPAPDYIHQVDRNLRLLQSIGLKDLDRHLSICIPDHILTQVSELSLYLLLNPWTSCQSRNYPSERWAEAAKQLSDQTGWPVVVTGVASDRDRAEPLLRILGKSAIDRVGQTNLSELAALVAKARLVLTNNTSVMHLADATQTPVVVAFSGTEQESQWQPRHTPSRLLRRSTVCSPCYSLYCPYQLQCLEISVEAIVQAALELLQPTKSPEVQQCES